MSRSSTLTGVLAVLAVCVSGLLWWPGKIADRQRDAQVPTVPSDGGTTQSEQGPNRGPVPAQGGLVQGGLSQAQIPQDPTQAVNEPPNDQTDVPTSQTLLLPDGTRVKALNGATNATPLKDAWPKDVPFSPIVRIERSDLGVDWYVHEDGSRSTTEMKWRSDLGREDAVTRLARPLPQSPNVGTPRAKTPK